MYYKDLRVFFVFLFVSLFPFNSSGSSNGYAGRWESDTAIAGNFSNPFFFLDINIKNNQEFKGIYDQYYCDSPLIGTCYRVYLNRPVNGVVDSITKTGHITIEWPNGNEEYTFEVHEIDDMELTLFLDDAGTRDRSNIHKTSVGNWDNWDTAYQSMFANQADVQTLRSYRDEMLAEDPAGKFYTEMLYRNSEEALNVLLRNQDLAKQAKRLIESNEEAVAKTLNGEDAVIDNTEEITDFLKQFAQESPRKLKLLSYVLRWQILKRHQSGKPFLGFTWE